MSGAVGASFAPLAIREASEADLPALLAITNQAIRETNSNWNWAEADLAERQAWLGYRARRGIPVLVACLPQVGAGAGLAAGPAASLPGGVVGFASAAPFRPQDGFARTLEHSVYIWPAAQGRGVGRALLSALIERLRADGVHALVGAIDAENTGSLRLHRSLGFVEVGRLPEVGLKFGRWLDLVLVQRILG